MDMFNQTNGNSAANVGNMADMFEQMGLMTDPRLRMIAEFMKTQNNARAEPDRDEERQAKLERAAARYRETKQQNRILADRIDVLAAALGACPACWGENDDCEMCSGKGVAGFYLPEKDAFVNYVLPAVRRLRRTSHKVQQPDGTKNDTTQ